MEKLDFKEISKIYFESKNELLHGGYTGEFLERLSLEQVFNKLKIEDKNTQANMVSFFNLGNIA